jgi:hypothetical protein
VNREPHRIEVILPVSEESRAHDLLRGRSNGKRPGSATAFGDYFPPRPKPNPSRGRDGDPEAQGALHRESQNSRRPPSSAALRPLSLRSAVQARSARRQVIATKAAMGAVNPTKGHHHDDRPRHLRI